MSSSEVESSVPLFTNIWFPEGRTLINLWQLCDTVTRPCETRRACFTLSERLKKAGGDWAREEIGQKLLDYGNHDYDGTAAEHKR